MPRMVPVLILFLLLVGCAHEIDPAYVAAVDQWHAQRVERLTADDGWLTLVGLHPLNEGINTIGSGADRDVVLIDKAPDKVGIITVGKGEMLFSAHPGASVVLVGAESTEPVLNVSLQPDSSAQPTVLGVESLIFYVIERGGSLFLRVKDQEAEVLKNFTGIDRFPVDDRWRVTARLEGEPGSVLVPNVLGQTSEAPSPGVLVFMIKGKEFRLTPQGEPGQGLFLVFGDDTNGKSTYSGGRFLSTDAPAADGTVVLDFNRSTNPPCVFTPYATCPLPSVDNLLNVAITAGEKMWGEPH
jgi:uncharacterized protein (DUF1684 family)